MIWTVKIFSFIIPITYSILGFLFWKQTPELKSGKSGWRTSYSARNEETWKYANKVGGRYLFTLGITELIITVVIHLLIRNLDLFYFVACITGLLALQTASFSYLNKYVEKNLKNM